jgi:hypothetical protein
VRSGPGRGLEKSWGAYCKLLSVVWTITCDLVTVQSLRPATVAAEGQPTTTFQTPGGGCSPSLRRASGAFDKPPSGAQHLGAARLPPGVTDR